MKQAVARAALEYVVEGRIIGVGTGSTARLFIEELAAMKDRIAGAVASSEDTRKRLEGHGIRVFDLNEITDMFPPWPVNSSASSTEPRSLTTSAVFHCPSRSSRWPAPTWRGNW